MVRFYSRFVRTLLRFLPFLVTFLRDRRRFVLFGPPRSYTREEHAARARRLAEALLDMGPTFIKIGQVLSTRPDLVPPVYAEELAALQDAVPAGDYSEIEPVIAESVGLDAFEEIERDPIAGGSLAQVHGATLRGERVAVKIRRPGVKDLVRTDLRVVRRLLPIVIYVAPERHRFSLRNVADDFERIIFEELNFEREAAMMAEIGDNFAGHEGVVIPSVYGGASSERVLTMAYVEGIKITDVEELEAAGFDPERVARDVANAYFKMGLEDGVFHGDPHPGNLAVDDRGRIVFYDFGMSGRFTERMQESVIDLYLAVVRRDIDAITDTLIDLDVLDPDVDRGAVRHVLQLVIEDLEGEHVDWRIIITEVGTMLKDFPFRIPPDIMLLIRIGTVSEGVLRQLNPEFDFIAAAREFLVEHGYMEQGVGELVSEVQGDLRRSAASLTRLPSRAEEVLDRAASGELEVRERVDEDAYLAAIGRPLGYAVLTGAWVVGAAILTTVEPRYGLAAFAVGALPAYLFARSVR
jgi:predicted unusual protein kinase regulating ubiquinone biosynthesis (AarF/ABC1/UbiB family)